MSHMSFMAITPEEAAHTPLLAENCQPILNAEDFAAMEAAADRASALLKALSHPLRLLLLCHLSQGERCVSDLETLVRLGQPSLSQQLGVLRSEGLVNTRREGKHIYYSVSSQEALKVLDTLYGMYCGPATGFKFAR